MIKMWDKTTTTYNKADNSHLTEEEYKTRTEKEIEENERKKEDAVFWEEIHKRQKAQDEENRKSLDAVNEYDYGGKKHKRKCSRLTKRKCSRSTKRKKTHSTKRKRFHSKKKR